MIWLLACGEPDCADGFEPRDGACHQEADPDDTDVHPPLIESVLATLPDCEATPTGGIDLEASCVGEVCAGMTADEITGVSGVSPTDCYPAAAGVVACAWGPGRYCSFDDANGDGQPDDGEKAFQVTVTNASYGTTSGGTGIDASLACAIDELGSPSEVLYETYAGELVVTRVTFETYYLVLTDTRVNASEADYRPDGYADVLLLDVPMWR